MRKMILAHCKALIQQQGTLLCFSILFLSIIVNFIGNVMKYWQKELAVRPSFLEISVLSETNKIGWYLVVFFAFLVVLPGGMSFAVDRKNQRRYFVVYEMRREKELHDIQDDFCISDYLSLLCYSPAD